MCAWDSAASMNQGLHSQQGIKRLPKEVRKGRKW